MKERPILFSGPMVRAILEGRKTVTRRVMRHQPHEDASVTVESYNVAVVDRHGEQQPGPEVFGAWWSDGERGCVCPYGQPGDRLWVRETWRVGKPHDKTAPADILPPLLAQGKGVTVLYDAGGWKSIGPAGRDEPSYPDDQPLPDWAGKGRPSIHMPRAFCRILLEITAVRVERLQDIGEGQSQAEGVAQSADPIFPWTYAFAELWEQINGKGAWLANPWVWVVEFKWVAP